MHIVRNVLVAKIISPKSFSVPAQAPIQWLPKEAFTMSCSVTWNLSLWAVKKNKKLEQLMTKGDQKSVQTPMQYRIKKV